MPLPLRQLRVLTYVAGRASVSARDVAVDLRMSRADAENTLRLLAARKLVSPDPVAFPTEFTVTGDGRAELAAGGS